MISFDGVTCSAGSDVLVRDLTLHVAQGETFVLLGRSGAGKTSALKLVNRLLKPDSGTIKVEGKSTRDWDPIALRRRIGYVIQETGLFPHFTVSENVGLVPRLEGWTTDRINARIAEVLQLVDLDPATYMHRHPQQLSGGQRQRVGVARALAADPPILLMDEPFGALDPLTRSELQREFLRLQKRLHKTILFVTHDVAEALMLGTRIALMEDGRLIAEGTPREFAESQHPSVQHFLQPIREMLSSISFV